MSLGAQKEFKMEQKRKQEINFKIRRADKNIRIFFEEIKKILGKDEEETVITDLPTAVFQAVYAEKEAKYVRFLYACHEAHTRRNNQIASNIHTLVPSYRLYKNDFVPFIRFFVKDLNEANATDVFMNLTKKLAAMLVKPERMEDTMNTLNMSPTLGTKNKDL